MKPTPAAALASLVALAAIAATPVHAAEVPAPGECSALVITGRGEPASFEWLAKTKARANWRTRVRNTRALGEAFSTWNRAQNREEKCVTARTGAITCTFSANPCHR